MSLTLVVLAAGAGSRYGGIKQIAPVGPCGETLMDYSVYDAWRAGFKNVVFVIRPEIEADFRTKFGSRHEGRLAVAYVHQRINDLPPPFLPPAARRKPWGTGHAVLAAAGLVDSPLAVANADDFYGAGSFRLLADFLRQPPRGEVPTYALISFALGATLTEAGPVSRGICRCAEDGRLIAITEVKRIQQQGGDVSYTDEDGLRRVLPDDTPVSMNLWAFQPPIFNQLGAGFGRFLARYSQSLAREFYLPSAINDLVQSGRAQVQVLPSGDCWCGITHAADKAVACRRIHQLVTTGSYPAPLWA